MACSICDRPRPNPRILADFTGVEHSLRPRPMPTNAASIDGSAFLHNSRCYPPGCRERRRRHEMPHDDVPSSSTAIWVYHALRQVAADPVAHHHHLPTASRRARNFGLTNTGGRRRRRRARRGGVAAWLPGGRSMPSCIQWSQRAAILGELLACVIAHAFVYGRWADRQRRALTQRASSRHES